MKSFSHRKGLKPVKEIIQVDSMDKDLRVGLWNVLTIFYWSQISGWLISSHDDMDTLIRRLWINYFKKPLDTLNVFWGKTFKTIKYRFFRCDWNEVYDFIEFVANNYPEEDRNKAFMKSCNSTLERELSGYRFVGGKITQITSEEEISAIEEALEISTPLKGVNTHLKSALSLSTDRKSPDYRNSIKESISAVEAICRLISGDAKTLGQCLKTIEKEVGIHPALKKAFSSLYGYTSSEEGIRHALITNETNLGFEDAKFMLVACSGFINYLKSKASKSGIKL